MPRIRNEEEELTTNHGLTAPKSQVRRREQPTMAAETKQELAEPKPRRS